MPGTKRTATGVLGGLAGLVGLSVAAAVLVTATVTPAIALTGTAASSAISLFEKLPSVLDIEKLMLPSTVYITNPDTGEPQRIAQFYDQNRSPVAFDQVAPVVYDAVLSSEDKNFYKHGGIDLVGTLKAFYDNARTGSSRGGSSISQQYVKNVQVQTCEAGATGQDELDDCYRQAVESSGTAGYQRKLQEMRYAIALEDKYSKNEILLGYLNIAGFGGTNYGIDAAARAYYSVSAAELNLNQAATLAGIVREPNTLRIDRPGGTYSDKDGVWHNSAEDGYADTKERRDYVIDRLFADGKITQEQHDLTKAEPITPVLSPPTTGCSEAVQYNAGYFCQFVKETILSNPVFGETAQDRAKLLQRGGLSIYTTLDPRMQNEAQATMVEAVPAHVDGISFGSAAVNLQNSTGRVLSMVQNTNFSEDANLLATDPNYSAMTLASDARWGSASDGFNAGSTFKLFTLVDWLEKGHSLNEAVNGTPRGTIGTYHNSCYGDSAVTGRGDSKIDNFAGDRGRIGNAMQFTASSLNTGFAAMAKQLDLCDIAKVGGRLGVTFGNGSPLKVEFPYSVLGPDKVSPLAMAGAYATIANNGVFCPPHGIDKITNADGVDLPLPDSTCTPVLDPKVAATAAHALRGVMTGGSGAAAAPNNRSIPVIGKTGTHQTFQTWVIEASTAVTTAVVVGTTQGEGNITRQYYNGRALNQVRHYIAKRLQTAGNNLYGGAAFPDPDANLMRTVLADLPDVIGKSAEEATTILTDAGFDVVVGEAVDSDRPAGQIAAQNPPGGKAAGGSTVTINPSNGQAVPVPDVTGQNVDAARAALNGAGFGNVQLGTCTPDAGGGPQGKVTATSPGGGSVVNRNSAVSIAYTKATCP